MKVVILKTGKAQTVSTSYGARLIEQGKAIPSPAQPKRKKAETKAVDA